MWALALVATNGRYYVKSPQTDNYVGQGGGECIDSGVHATVRYSKLNFYEDKVKSSRLSLRETRDKRPLGSQ